MDEGDEKKLDNLRLAFNVLQVPPNMCTGIFQTLSAILWLGNLTFQVNYDLIILCLLLLFNGAGF